MPESTPFPSVGTLVTVTWTLGACGFRSAGTAEVPRQVSIDARVLPEVRATALPAVREVLTRFQWPVTQAHSH